MIAVMIVQPMEIFWNGVAVPGSNLDPMGYSGSIQAKGESEMRLSKVFLRNRNNESDGVLYRKRHDHNQYSTGLVICS